MIENISFKVSKKTAVFAPHLEMFDKIDQQFDYQVAIAPVDWQLLEIVDFYHPIEKLWNYWRQSRV